MEEQLISFETAKLAKEKGFTWKDFEDLYKKQIYIEGTVIPSSLYNKLNNEEIVQPNVGRFTISDGYIENQHLEGLIMCSTQSLLQKWLREVHKIVIEIQTGYYPCIYTSYNYENPNGFLGFNEVEKYAYPDKYAIYEQSLEVGLLNALNLI